MTRERLPDTRRSITHRVKIWSEIRETPIKLFITVGYYEDGRPGEVFIQVDEKGTELSGFCIVVGILMSMCLQSGVSPDKIHEKLSYQDFEPRGFTDNPEIKVAQSVADYVVRFMANTRCEKGVKV